VQVQIAAAADERTLERRLESVKHYLWHGNSVMALEGLSDVGAEDWLMS